MKPPMARRPQPDMSHLPRQGKETPTERPAAAVQPFAYAPPGVARVQLPNRTELGALVFPQTVQQFEAGVLLLADQVAARPSPEDPFSPRGYEYQTIRKDHVAANPESWEEERQIMEPLLLQFLWNSICTFLAKPAMVGQRVVFGGLPSITVGQPEVTGRVQVSARAHIALEPSRGEPK